MNTKLIKLKDGTLVEVKVSEKKAREEISGGMADKVESTFDKMKPILLSVCQPIRETYKELNKDMSVEEVNVELGLRFEAQGNIFVTSSKAAANLTIKLVLKPKA